MDFMGVHFIAAFQVLIYVGAVMVFMVFVIMLLEVREAPGNNRYSSICVIPGGVIFVMMLGVLGNQCLACNGPCSFNNRAGGLATHLACSSSPPSSCATIGCNSN